MAQYIVHSDLSVQSQSRDCWSMPEFFSPQEAQPSNFKMLPYSSVPWFIVL